MSEISLSVDGVPELQKKLEKIGGLKALMPVFETQGHEIHNIAGTYPPKPPESKYKRTYVLANSWSSKAFLSKGKVGVRVKNTAARRGRPYAMYVMGPKHDHRFARGIGARQAEIHAGRWPTLAGIAEKRTKNTMKEIQAKIDQILKE